MTKMRVEELEANLLDVLARVKAGETVEIQSEGRSFAQIGPCDRFSELDKVLPGIIHATVHMRDVKLHAVHLTVPSDSAAALIEDRADNAYLP